MMGMPCLRLTRLLILERASLDKALPGLALFLAIPERRSLFENSIGAKKSPHIPYDTP